MFSNKRPCIDAWVSGYDDIGALMKDINVRTLIFVVGVRRCYSIERRDVLTEQFETLRTSGNYRLIEMPLGGKTWLDDARSIGRST
jgi:hypothetical protein